MPQDTPTVLFVHGVGMWPGHFSTVAEMIDNAVICLVRPGYCGHSRRRDFESQVDAVATALVEHGPAAIVGVSGGATLALALALRRPPGLAAVVTHEPLIGALEPGLHDDVRRLGRALRRDPSPRAVRRFLDRLYGPALTQASPEALRFVERHTGTIAREVAHFASFDPDPVAISAMKPAHLTTVGSHSPPTRHLVAERLETLGATRAVIRGAGHLVPVDAPAEFAAAISTFLGSSTR